MIYVEAPTEWVPGSGSNFAIFLAGGITGCPDWQAQFASLFADHPITMLNPRRAEFPKGDPDAAEEQIMWEHRHLRKADYIIFWFCAEQTQPIALYELGAWCMTDKPIAVGIELGYPREFDVRVQTELVRPDIPITDNLGDLAYKVMTF